MISEKTADVLMQLHRFTGEGKLGWEETSQPDTYRVRFPAASVEIKKRSMTPHAQASVAPTFVLRFLNEDDQLIDEADDFDFSRIKIDNSYKVLEEIYNMARHIAMGVEKTMDDILFYLDEIDEIMDSGVHKKPTTHEN